MHLNAILRGQDDKVFRLMQDCQAVYFPYMFKYPWEFVSEEVAKDFLEKNKEAIGGRGEVFLFQGKWAIKGERWMQMGVRPLVPVEFTFPEEHLDLVLKMLHPQGSWNKSYNKYLALIRKFLGLEKIPKFEHRLIDALPTRATANVEVAGIGIKEDRIIDGIEQI